MTRAPAHSRRVGALAVLAAGACAALPAAAAVRRPIGAYTTKGAWSFASARSLHPPMLLTVGRPVYGKLARGRFLLANFPNLTATEPAHGRALTMIGQSGPLILDNHLEPVWFHPVPTNVVAADLQQEVYLGKPVLVWWQGGLTNTGVTT